MLFDDDICSIIEAIKEMALCHPWWSFLKISRQANAHADSLANWATERKFFSCVPLDYLPAFLLRQTLVFDAV